MKRPVRIVDYNSQLPILFENEKRLILNVIRHFVVEIEHVGSTAVVGLGAKPIIDITVAIKNLKDAHKCIRPLESIGYEYVPEYEESIPERRYFHKGKPPKEQHYHLHMVELTSDFWERHLLFRDYLRAHPESAQEYYELKKKLAIKYGSDREGYTNAKTSFIESVVSKAKSIRRKTRPVEFVVGCDLEEFKEYYKRNGYVGELGTGELGITEEKIVTQEPSHLIVWRENDKIIGHAIWHETNTEEHRKGDPRDKEDREILRNLLGEKRDFVELHEIWLMKEYRGKGYGKKFFAFFEEFMRKKDYDSIIYYAFHPAALTICRQRGYKEDYLTKEAEYVFYLLLK